MRWKGAIIFLVGVLFFSPLAVFAQAYGTNFITGGEVSCDSQNDEGNQCAYSVDENLATTWVSAGSAHPHWWKYNLGTSTQKTVGKVRINTDDSQDDRVKEYGVLGSSDDSGWTQLATTTRESTIGWTDFEIEPTEAYQYFKIVFTAPNWEASNFAAVNEIQMMECESGCGEEAETMIIPSDFTEMCYEETTASGTLTGCYRPFDVYKILIADFLVFVGVMTGVFLLMKKVFNI